MKKNNFVVEKNPPDRICNICLKHFDVLSEDHVPPESTGNHGNLEYQYYYNVEGKIQFREFANGIRYKTICQKCNGRLSDFDRCIATLYKQSWQTGFLNSNVHDFNIKPNGIIRGILGHFISAKSTHNRSVFDEFCASSCDNDNITTPIPQSFYFYVKYYPFDDIRVIRDLVILGRSPILICVMKIKPWAFIVTDQEIYDNKTTLWNSYYSFPWHQKKKVSIVSNPSCLQNEPEGSVELVKMLGLLATESIIGKKTKVRQ